MESEAFKELKDYLAKPPILVASTIGKALFYTSQFLNLLLVLFCL